MDYHAMEFVAPRSASLKWSEDRRVQYEVERMTADALARKLDKAPSPSRSDASTLVAKQRDKAHRAQQRLRAAQRAEKIY